MERYPDPPLGWLQLRERMKAAKTPREVDEIVEEMKKVLDAYEAKIGSGRRSQTQPALSEDSDQTKTQ